MEHKETQNIFKAKIAEATQKYFESLENFFSFALPAIFLSISSEKVFVFMFLYFVYVSIKKY